MVDLKLEKIDAQTGGIDLQLGMAAIMGAIAKGHDRRLLRWRVSSAQASAMFMSSFMVAINPSPISAAMESGVIHESGVFCGIPYAVDHSLPPACILLEKLEPTPIIQIDNLACNRWFEKK